jgi:calpain-15
VLDDKDGTFWMSFQDFIKYFRCLNVCRVRNWQENRIRGKFIRITEKDNEEASEQVLSKWFYEFSVDEATEMFIGIHQEDDRKQGVSNRRPFIDVGLCIMKVNEDDGSLDLKDYNKLSRDRQVELGLKLLPGKYVVLPKTTGGLMCSKP